MLSAVKNHFRFKEASFVGIKLENCLPSLCSNNKQIATCHLQLSFYKRSANSKNEEQILALERRTGFFGERRTIQRRNSLFCSPRVFIPAKRALRPRMLLRALRPGVVFASLASTDAFQCNASHRRWHHFRRCIPAPCVLFCSFQTPIYTIPDPGFTYSSQLSKHD